ncbi:MAG TPA: hypothetical protein V6D26_05735 [Stenomitos sp.]
MVHPYDAVSTTKLEAFVTVNQGLWLYQTELTPRQDGSAPQAASASDKLPSGPCWPVMMPW